MRGFFLFFAGIDLCFGNHAIAGLMLMLAAIS